MKTKKHSPLVLGKGSLNWYRAERISDRYGTVHLSDEDGNLITLPHQVGMGTLLAKVIEPRRSSHIGDLARGLFPVTPKIGDEITLGHGAFFSEMMAVGVKPHAMLETDWLNPRALYNVHESIVELIWVPDGATQ